MNTRNRKRKGYFSLLGMGVSTIAIVMLLMFSGCPTEYRDWSPPQLGVPGAEAPPATPVIVESGHGFVFVPEVMANLGDADAVRAAIELHEGDEEGGTVPVIAIIWTGANTAHFNIYWNIWPARPAYPQITGIPGNETVFYIRDGLVGGTLEFLQPDTEYFIWVEAVNAHGAALSAPINVTTRNRGGDGQSAAGGTLERMDYPRGIGIEPGDGQITVWWNLYSRIGWNEIYVVRVGNTVEFSYDGETRTHRYGVRSVNVFEPATFTNPWGGGNAAANHVGTPIWPWFSWGLDRGWLGYRFGAVDGIYDSRQVVGISDLDSPGRVAGGVFHPANPFPFVFESWREGDHGPGNPQALGRLVPYRPISSFQQFMADDVFPWDPETGRVTNTPGVPIAHWANHATITGLQNGVEYEIWIRVPNVFGERGFGVIRGTPGPATMLAPTAPAVTPPEGTTRNLLVSWNPVPDAEAYRVFYSPFNEPPGPRTRFQRITPQNNNEGRQEALVLGLMPGTQYFIWIAAEQNGVAGNHSAMITGTTGFPTTGQMRRRYDVNGFPVTTLMYIEVNDNNILNAGDYILEDGTFLWDYIVIFAANLRQRNCAMDDDASIHGCTHHGVHIHFNENVRHILEHRSTFIQPLQDKGIRVKLGLLGDWDGIGFGSMNSTEIDDMVRHIVEIMERYDLDGVDFDDEWSNDMRMGGFPSQAAWVGSPEGMVMATAVYPAHAFSWPFTITVWRDPQQGVTPGNVLTSNPGAAYLNEMWLQGGRNFYETLRRTRVAFNELEGRLPVRPQDIAYQGGVRRLTISLYEFNKARWVTPGDGVNEGYGLTNYIRNRPDGQGEIIRATSESLAQIIDFAMQPWYNQWHWDSPNNLPRTMFSPLAIDVSGHAYAGQNNSPNPTFPGMEGGGRPISIQTVANRFRAASDAAAGLGPGESPFVAQYMANVIQGGEAREPFGMIFFYNLRPASMLLSETPGGPAIRTVEEYLSYLTRTIFGQETILTVGGGDRPKGF